MSSPTEADEEDVEFVSEGPLRPVLECIDLLSDEEEGSSSMANTIEDQIDRQKAHVASTLDRLARQVAVEKRERADKCRAFKEKQISQKVHGQQEVALGPTSGNDPEAKRCVDMWLKMPGLRPGVINTGYGGRRRPPPFPTSSSTKHTCPVINCGRVYDGVPLLEGHLKRFDHSPCDPTVNLKGSLSEIYACVACGHHFDTKESWRLHLQSKLSSSNAEGHTRSQTCQLIVCFACPACYLLFSLRDECLQHMSAANHFSEAVAMSASTGRALPVPVPQYGKNRLIALCKDVSFSVRCSLCRKVLVSHQAAQAHFNVRCRQGCAVAEADRSVAQVMKQLQPRGQCSLCCKTFLSQVELEKHRESTQHGVEVNRSVEAALLQYCRFSEIQHARRAKEKTASAAGPAGAQRDRKRSHAAESPAKRQKLGPSVNGTPSGRGGRLTVAWFCECGLRFSEEDAASRHLFAANQLFHQCGVCGKLMGESAVARLHMSRFHGGAHLTNILYHCRACKVDMPRREDILLHVSEFHGGHTYFTEREVPEEEAPIPHAKTPAGGRPAPSSDRSVHAAPSSSSTPEQQWMCRMCEDLFDSEDAVHQHCGDLSKHSFQRFVCGHCPQRFFKRATLRMHCVSEHGGRVEVSHFCGLCDSMEFASEGEFLEHFESVHSRDYCRTADGTSDRPETSEDSGQLPTTSTASEGSCPCMGSEKSKEERRATYTQCMRSLAAEGKCGYACAPCGLYVSSFALIKTHVHTTHPALNLDKTFDVECGACRESFPRVHAFHQHYHAQHCPLEPCRSTDGRGQEPAPTTTTAAKAVMLDAVEIKPDVDGCEDGKLATVLNMDTSNTGVSDAREGLIPDESDEEMRHALALSAAEAAKESTELEEVLKRSLVDF